MNARSSLTLILALALVTLAGCSKTEDSAPDRTIFGTPPVIQSASVEVNPNATATCDFTDAFNFAFICVLTTNDTGEGPVDCSECCADNFNCAGKGLRKCAKVTEFGVQVCYECRPLVLSVPTTVTVNYTELVFRANVSDPDSPTPSESDPDRSDVLAVTASFKDEDNKVEDSLVLLDDGSANTFPFGQRSATFAQDCNYTADGLICQGIKYQVSSGDPAPGGDGTFTRHFAFANDSNPTSELIQDCAAKQNGVVGKKTVVPELRFLIEAVDRSGNIASWPDELLGGDHGSSLTCSGDRCFCCFLGTQLQDIASCFGLPGLAGPDFPFGACQGGP